MVSFFLPVESWVFFASFLCLDFSCLAYGKSMRGQGVDVKERDEISFQKRTVLQ